MLKRLVVGLNGSGFSFAAGELAIAWAKTHSASVLGVGVVDTPLLAPAEPVPIGGAAFKRERDAAVLAAARQHISGLLSAYTQSCQTAGVQSITRQVEGDADDVLAGECQRGDLLVVGLKRRAGESVASPLSDTLEAVLKKSSRPVLCVPATATAGEAVVVAYDGSLPAARAMFALAHLGLFASQPIHVIAVEEVAGQHAGTLANAQEFLAAHGYQVQVEGLPMVRNVEDTLLARVTALRPQLVVMGTHGKGWLREMLFGSVTKTLLAKLSVPMLFDH